MCIMMIFIFVLVTGINFRTPFMVVISRTIPTRLSHFQKLRRTLFLTFIKSGHTPTARPRLL